LSHCRLCDRQALVRSNNSLHVAQQNAADFNSEVRGEQPGGISQAIRRCRWPMLAASCYILAIATWMAFRPGSPRRPPTLSYSTLSAGWLEPRPPQRVGRRDELQSAHAGARLTRPAPPPAGTICCPARSVLAAGPGDKGGLCGMARGISRPPTYPRSHGSETRLC
jgi:hypothetical protein